ncbi:MAG: hypothetical protein ABH843_05100 [Candidatus Omnitrophota bacterium]
MKEMANRLRELIGDVKIGIRYYRLARRYSRRNTGRITTESLKGLYEKV